MTDLLDIASGDERRARVLREILTQLQGSPRAELREMARAVLNGEIGLREAALNGAYGTALCEAFGTFWSGYRELSPEERADLEASGRPESQGQVNVAFPARSEPRHSGGN